MIDIKNKLTRPYLDSIFATMEQTIMKSDAQLVKVLVRMPPDVHAWLNAQCRVYMGSKNSEIIRCIRAQMEQRSQDRKE